MRHRRHRAPEGPRRHAHGVLLDNGAEVDRAQEDGETPLEVAQRKGHAAVVALLEEHRSDRGDGAEGNPRA